MIMPLELEEARRDVIIVSSPAGPIFSFYCFLAPARKLYSYGKLRQTRKL